MRQRELTAAGQRVPRLAVLARQAVAAAQAGLHPSRRKGSGLEFGQFRSYVPGDDLRRLDWKLYARSDRFFIRESESESQWTAHLVLDATASMAYGPASATKLDAACVLLAAVALMFHQQGDALALTIISGQGVFQVSPQAGASQLARIWHHLETVQGQGAWPFPMGPQPFPMGGMRSLVFVVTDLHEAGSEISAFLNRLPSGRAEVTLGHVLSADELDLPFAGPHWLEDLETGERRMVNAPQIRAEYRRQMAAHLDAVAADAKAKGRQYLRFQPTEATSQVLLRWGQLRGQTVASRL